MKGRFLHVVRSLRPETGGIAEAVRQLVRAQTDRGDVVTVLSLDPADARDPTVVMAGRHSHGYGFSRAYTEWLRREHAAFDLVVVHGLWQYQTLGAWRALRRTRTPYAVFCHGMLDVWFKRAHPLKHAKKWLYWPWAERRVLREAAAVCFTTAAEQQRARSGWPYQARECIVPIGIAPPADDVASSVAAFQAAFPALAGRPFVLFLGRVDPKKGVDVLLRGFAAAFAGTGSRPRLVVAGPARDGVTLRTLQELASELGIGADVAWLPMLVGEVKWGALRSCEAFALISHQENFGVAVAEALACGRPVLLSDAVAIAYDVAADGAGIVVPDTAAGAGDALRRWQALTHEARAAMSRAARACFARRFVVSRTADELAALATRVRAAP